MDYHNLIINVLIILILIAIPFFLVRAVFEALQFFWKWCFVIIGCTILLVIANTYYS